MSKEVVEKKDLNVELVSRLKIGRSFDYLYSDYGCPVLERDDKENKEGKEENIKKDRVIGRSFDYLYPPWENKNENKKNIKNKPKGVEKKEKTVYSPNCDCTWNETCSYCQ